MSSSPTSTVVEVTMPQMGVSVAEGTIADWKKRPGDWVERDETIVEISTDKIETEIQSPANGRVTEILVEVGVTVPIGAVLAKIDTGSKPGQAHADLRPAYSEAVKPGASLVGKAMAPGSGCFHMVALAQLARAPGWYPGDDRFESGAPPCA